MATFQKFNSFTEAVAEGVHNLGADTLTVALCATAPVAGDAVLADLSGKVISYTNISSRVLTLSAGGSAQVGGVYTLKLDDLTLTASGAVPTFQYVVIYNETATNDELIGFYNYGSGLDLADGESLLIDFSDASGVLTIT